MALKLHLNVLTDLQEDVCLEGYRKHLVSRASDAPLTAAEEELQIIKQTEVFIGISVMLGTGRVFSNLIYVNSLEKLYVFFFFISGNIRVCL